MKGLLLYYWYTLKNKFILTTTISIIIAGVSIIEKTHELAVIYFISSLSLLITFDNEKENIKNSVMEKVLPLKNYKVVGIKYIILLFSLFLGICFTLFYLLMVKKWFDPYYDYNSMINIMWNFIGAGLSIGSIAILKNSIGRHGMKFYLLYLLPIIQLTMNFHLLNSKFYENWIKRNNSIIIIQIVNVLVPILIAIVTFWKSIELKGKKKL